MTARRVAGTILALLPVARVPAAADESFVRPSLSVLGVSECGRGEACDVAPNVGAGLDGRGLFGGGRVDWSAFAFAHDPTTADERGFFAAARARGFTDLGETVRLRFDASGRLQRRETATLSDFERSDVSLTLERRFDGAAIGVRLGDRRRSVRDSDLGFSRQSFLGSLTWGSGGSQWRLEAGPQRGSAVTAGQWRLLGTAEWAGRLSSWTAAVRATWIEPIEGRVADAAAAPELTSFPVVPVPAPGPGGDPNPLPPPVPTPVVDTGPRTGATTADASREGLLGPALVVDPLEDDENDWDIGLRKQQVVAFVTRTFPRTSLTAEVRLDVERGPDRLSPGSADVERERLAARVHLRRALGTRWAFLAQGGWQRLNDARPGLGYSHGLVSAGIELRP